jgi:hypothetical protein
MQETGAIVRAVPSFCMLPAEAVEWVEQVAATRSLAVLADPRISYRRWLGTPEMATAADLHRPGEFGLVMVDLPQRESNALLVGELGFKAYDGFPAAAEVGRRLAGLLRRDLRRVCTVPLLARHTPSGALAKKPSCWASARAATEAQRGLTIKQLGVQFGDFVLAATD